MSDVDDEELPEEGNENPLGEYEGERNEKNERHGQGKAVLKNGDTYEGMYENGKRNGAGTYIFKKNNARFIGDYKDNEKHGRGTFIYPDGSVYDGDWAHNKRNGQGKYTYVNGDTYEGEFKNNHRHGVGVYTYAQTGTKYFGQWQKGKQIGHGELQYSNHKFIGRFRDNEPIGNGRFLFENGFEQRGVYVRQSESDGSKGGSSESVKNADGTPVPIWKPSRIMAITGETSVADAIEREKQMRIEDLAAAMVAKVQMAAANQLLAEQKAALLAEELAEEEEEEEVEEEEYDDEEEDVIGSSNSAQRSNISVQKSNMSQKSAASGGAD